MMLKVERELKEAVLGMLFTVSMSPMSIISILLYINMKKQPMQISLILFSVTVHI